MDRRHFLRTSGIFSAGMYSAQAMAIAGPFLPGEILHNIPADKKLDPDWVRSLSKRGIVTRYLKSKNELRYIGMPVGGVNAGTVYLGGEGRLWLWDIFNENQNGIDPKTIDWHSDVHAGKKVRSQDGSAYVQPAVDIRPLKQGFAFRIRMGDKTVIKQMEYGDWDEIVFEATYPMAKVRYVDRSLPVEIVADIFSPFIPLDDKNSSLPCTIHSFGIHNRSAEPVEMEILGWLENKVSPRSAHGSDQRMNEVQGSGEASFILCSMRKNNDPKQAAEADFGTMAIAPLSGTTGCHTDFRLPVDDSSFSQAGPETSAKHYRESLIGAVVSRQKIEAGGKARLDFIISWHFKNLQLHKNIADKGRYYNNWFGSAADVIGHVRTNHQKLSEESRAWKETWYDSTLPWWFLERTFLNISCLATTTAHRFESGRFYAWEGVGCCPGTCTHVWQYAQAMGRIFPTLERDTRERVDLGISLKPDGMIRYRGEAAAGPAIDGQAGTILRIWREHQMSKDDAFLRRNWEKIKKALEWLMAQDRNHDGMEDTPIENTLDAVWDGEIAWLVGLCIAAVKAGQRMAGEMSDAAFEKSCAAYVEMGSRNMEEKLFNGEYFIHRPDAVIGRQKLGSYNTCHIDQVYGQSWAFQAGLGRIIDRQKTLSALKALWKYNFTPDVGPYIKERKGARPYALPGEGGLVMNTNPRNEAKPYGENITWQLGYFHECMSGFEHQVASHMMAEGMIDEALVITRMIHDRYHAAKRNPFNEIECSDHYARAMASYGTFITACGFEYHGPKGYMRFAPKMDPAHFKAPFTAAEAWGTYAQKKSGRRMEADIHVKYGTLSLKSLSLDAGRIVRKCKINLDDRIIPATISNQGGEAIIHFNESVTISAGKQLNIIL